MRDPLRFDGKVALITGAGRGLGRAYALYLAARGAAVMVNDPGARDDGDGSDIEPATAVVDEIARAGGSAAANFGSVSESSQQIVAAAIETFGRLDILINNAGFDVTMPFADDVVPVIRRHMDVHFFGTVGMTHAAWPHLAESGVGRVVNTTSPTLSGRYNQSAYVSAKGAIWGLTRCLALEGVASGIRVNSIAPTAGTRMSETSEAPPELKSYWRDHFTVDDVAPVVAYLAHEQCAVTGETLLAAGGRVQRLALGESTGIESSALTPEDLRDEISTILDPRRHRPYDLVPLSGRYDPRLTILEGRAG